MITLTILFSILFYFLMAAAVTAYYKLYKWDGFLNADYYIVGFIWPIYLFIVVPFNFISRHFEKILKSNKEKARPKIRVPNKDEELYEAEEEVEEYLSRGRL